MKVFDSIPDKCPETPLLDRVNSPSDLKQLKENQLEELCDELREFLFYLSCVAYAYEIMNDIKSPKIVEKNF